MKYHLTFTAEFEIEAENAVIARRVANKIRASPRDTYGHMSVGRHDSTVFSMKRVAESVRIDSAQTPHL